MNANPWAISDSAAAERDRIVAAQILDVMIECKSVGITRPSTVLHVLEADGFSRELYDRLMPLMNEELKQRGMA
jgi:hypothetical protein